MEEKSLLPILLGEFRDKMERLKELVQREVQFPDAPNKILECGCEKDGIS